MPTLNTRSNIRDRIKTSHPTEKDDVLFSGNSDSGSLTDTASMNNRIGRTRFSDATRQLISTRKGYTPTAPNKRRRVQVSVSADDDENESDSSEGPVVASRSQSTSTLQRHRRGKQKGLKHVSLREQINESDERDDNEPELIQSEDHSRKHTQAAKHRVSSVIHDERRQAKAVKDNTPRKPFLERLSQNSTPKYNKSFIGKVKSSNTSSIVCVSSRPFENTR